MVHDPAGIRAERVLLVGMGKAAETGARELRQAAEAAAGAARGGQCPLPWTSRSWTAGTGRMDTRRMARHVVEAMDAVLYRYNGNPERKEEGAGAQVRRHRGGQGGTQCREARRARGRGHRARGDPGPGNSATFPATSARRPTWPGGRGRCRNPFP